MKKAFATCLWVLVALTASLVLAQATVVKVKVQSANVRTAPDFNSTVIQSVPLGTLLEVSAKEGDWYKVTVSDESGNTFLAYIHSRVVDVVAGDAPREPEPVRPVEPEAVEEPEAAEPPAEDVTYEPVRTEYRRRPSVREFPSGGVKLMGGLAQGTFETSETEMEGIDLNDYKESRSGYLGGLGFEMGSRLALEIDLLYIQKGMKYAGDIPEAATGYSGTFSVTSEIAEASVPVLLKLRLLPGNTPYLLGGGEVGYILSHKVRYKAEVEGQQGTLSGTEDALKGTNRLDYGVVLGAGFELNTFAIPLFIEARYHLGMADIAGTDEETPEVKDTDTVKTRAIVVMAGIRF